MTDDTRGVYEAIIAAQSDQIACALATIIETNGSIPRHVGSKMLVYADGSIVGTVGGGLMESRVIELAQAIISTGQAQIQAYTLNDIAEGDAGICGGTARIFIEPISVRPRLMVIGGGHVGQALAQLGKWMQYHVTLVDDRADYATVDRVAGLDEYVICAPDEILDHVKVTPTTYIAAVTRGLPIDLRLIPTLLQTSAAYIGIIGSRRRWALTVQALRESAHVSEEDLKRIHAPIGLEIEAETPREIAVSIMAEIIMVQRGGDGRPMTWLRDGRMLAE